jgi:actin-related protein
MFRYSAFKGGPEIASEWQFRKSWISKQEYQEQEAAIFNQKRLIAY